MSENKTPVTLEKFLSDVASAEVDIHNYGELETNRIISLLCDFGTLFRTTSVYPEHDKNQQDADMLYTRLAALLSLWLSTEDIKFTQAQFFDFMLCKPTISAIFYASGFRGTNHLVNYLSNKAEDGTSTIPHNRLIALLTVIHIDDLSPELLQIAKKIDPNQYLVLIMGWLNSSLVLTARGEYNRKELIKDSGLLLRLDANHRFLDGLLNIWMNASYFMCENKYEIKKNINSMLANYMKKNYKASKPKKNFILTKDKPKLVIIHERLTDGHAMLRCFAPHFVELKEYFDIVSIGEASYLDDVGKALFEDNYVVIEPHSVEQAIKKINQINPDIIFYPSLGMSRWTVMLANLRLAPIQVMSCGHPDTSHIPTIDYIWSCELPKEGYQYLSEVCIADPLIPFKCIPHSNFITVSEKLSTGGINIAINCTKMKLNNEFLDVIKRIESSNENVVLHFFPYVYGFEFDFTKQMILRLFPKAIVHSSMSYNDFMSVLNSCHLSLAPFPFGNANSTVDALLLDIPVVSMYGLAPYSVTDNFVLEAVGLDDLSCSSEEEYIALANKLISDNDYYVATVERIRNSKVESVIYDKSQEISTNSFANILFSIFKKHEKIKSMSVDVVNFELIKKL